MKAKTFYLKFKTKEKTEFVNITEEIEKKVEESKVKRRNLPYKFNPYNLFGFYQ